MKNYVKPLVCASMFAAVFSAGIAGANPLLDQLNIAQINPSLVTALATQGSVITFYGENYVVNSPAVCSGPSFNTLCTVGLEHLSANPGVTVQIKQHVADNQLVTTVTTKPDGKTYSLVYNQAGGTGSALNVVNIKRTDGM